MSIIMQMIDFIITFTKNECYKIFSNQTFNIVRVLKSLTMLTPLIVGLGIVRIILLK